MATERRYLKGDHIEVVEYPDDLSVGYRFGVLKQSMENGVVECVPLLSPYKGPLFVKFYAHQVKLVKRPWWNWLRLPFCEVVLNYDRSKAK